MTMCLAAASAVFAQSARTAADHTDGARPVTKAEGRLIVLATSSADKATESESDCSHLVHDVYERAGFSYRYVNSRDLYTGNANFVRVHFPQPGDLIVWRGHVGIVIDPKEHSFFSSLRAGVDTQFYDSAYWRARGVARFYRYVTDKPFRAAETLAAARRLSRKGDPARTGETEKAAGLATGNSPADSETKLVDVPASVDPGPPRERVLKINGRVPTPGEVASALAEINEDSASMLRDAALGNPGRPVIVYGELQVISVHVKGLRGVAETRVESLASLPSDENEAASRWKNVSLELQKTRRGWVIERDAQEIYIPREAALQVLTERLALLTQAADASPEHAREQAEIIRFLNLLLPREAEASAQRD